MNLADAYAAGLRAVDEAARPGPWSPDDDQPVASAPPPKTGMALLLDVARQQQASPTIAPTIAAAPVATVPAVSAPITAQAIEAAARAEFQASADLRAEFRNEATYIAYRRAEARGAAKVYGGAVQRFTATTARG